MLIANLFQPLLFFFQYTTTLSIHGLTPCPPPRIPPYSFPPWIHPYLFPPWIHPHYLPPLVNPYSLPSWSNPYSFLHGPTHAFSHHVPIPINSTFHPLAHSKSLPTWTTLPVITTVVDTKCVNYVRRRSGVPGVPNLPQRGVPGDGVPAVLLDPVQVEQSVSRVSSVLQCLQILDFYN